MMKKQNFKKMFGILLCMCMLFSSFTVVSANDNMDTPLVIKFEKFKFETKAYNPKNVIVEYSKTDTKELAVVKDKVTEEILDEFVVERKAQTKGANDTYPYILTRTTSYGKTKVKLSVNVEMWSSGPYAQINSIQGKYLGIESKVTSTKIEGSNVNVWSAGNKFPTTKLLYAYNGTLVATVTSSTSSSIKAELEGAGFSVSQTVGKTTYYRRSMDESGTISLY